MENNEISGSKDYEVGDKRPPKDKQWKPGQSGNPKGKPKGTLHAKTIINKWLEVKQDFRGLNGKKKKMTQLDIMVIKQVRKAKNGDVKSFNALIDRTEGKPVMPVEMEHEMGKSFFDFLKETSR